MPSYTLTHLADAALLRDLTTLVAKDRITTAELLAHLAEVDARQLYLPAAYPSMFAYCVGELRLSEDCTAKRIQAARTARRCPSLFAAVADGRVHLAAVILLSPHISSENAEELIEAAAHKTKAEIEALLAGRAPELEMPAQVCAVAETPTEHAPGHVDQPGTSPARPAQKAEVSACSAKRYAIQATISQAAHADLRHAQDLLAHQLPSGDLGAVLERALRALVEKLEHRKYAATSKPRAARAIKGGRHVPASARRAVRERDGEQCTFTSEAGHRCEARKFLEYDHVVPVARGGESTVTNLRLRCRAHNQYMAERTYGAVFMRQKREEAKQRSAERRSVKGCAEELKPYLQKLGFRAQEIRRAAEYGATLAGASLEERVRAACRMLSRVPPSRPAAAAAT